MYYCPDCMRLRERDRCPICGTKNLMAPQPGDLCFLEEKDVLWAGMLEDVLNQAGIVHVARSDREAGLAAKLGRIGETVRFYVPFERMPEARELTDRLFHLPEEPEEIGFSG